MSLQTITCKWTGIRPLIMTNPQTVQVSCKYSIESRNLNSLMKAARKKEDANRMIELEQQIMRNDWESSAYWNEKESQFYIPDTCVAACIKSGATKLKKGKDIDRAVIINSSQIPVLSKRTFKSLDGAWLDEEYKLSGPAKIPPKTGALIWKCRCMIPTGWTMTVSADYDTDFITKSDIEMALKYAGAICGIGGWRPKFGRFSVEIL